VHAHSDKVSSISSLLHNSTNREQRYARDGINDISTSSKGPHNATLRPTLRSVIATVFASCGGTENKISTDVPSLTRQRAKQNSMPVPPRGEGGLGVLMISSTCTNMFADSGEGALLRQSESAVVFFPITCDACSASPPLRKTGLLDSNSIQDRKAYLAYRISLPRPPAFRGLTSKPLRTALSIGVANGTPCCSKVNPNRSALPPSVHRSPARARRVLDTGIDGREGPCDGERNLDRSGSTKVLGGVDGRGVGLNSIGGFNILVDFGACGAGTAKGERGGERIRVEPVAGTFSFGTNLSGSEFWAGHGRGESFLGWRSRSTSDKGRDLGVCFCFCLEGPGCGKLEVVTRESAKSERKFGTPRRD